MVRKVKILTFSAILLILLMATINATFSVATTKQGLGASIEVDKTEPTKYGVHLQGPNMYSTMAINGYHQGNFTIMNWDNTLQWKEEVGITGNDISFMYPWYFNNYLLNTATPNNYTDPWTDVHWFNVSAEYAQNDTLSPYTLNSVYNYYSMAEGESLGIPLNSTIPTQVDVSINAIGPKMLSLDFLTDNPTAVTINSIAIISPSGIPLNFDIQLVQYSILFGTSNQFYYLAFIAHEAGVYKLLMDVSYTKPALINLKFLSFNIATLATDLLTYGGNGDDLPNWQDVEDAEWSSYWYRISGTKGDKFRLDLGTDYGLYPPIINIWYPCENGYLLETGLGFGTEDLFFPATGDLYISISETWNVNVQRFSLLLKKIESEDYIIGGNMTTVKVSRDERKALDFTVGNDSFVRINYTTYGLGNPIFAGFDDMTYDFTSNALTFIDAKKQWCFETIYPIETKTIGTIDCYYYYMPAGDYEVIIQNTDVRYDGVIQISSQYLNEINATIPINNLVYPNTNPSTFQSITFTPDEWNATLKNGQWITINITEPGQYRLNTTMWAADNPGAAATASPTYLYTFNQSATPQYTDSAYPIWTFGSDSPMTSDYFYIGSHCRYTGMIFNFSTVGSATGLHDMQVYTGSWTDGDLVRTDGTSDLTQDGIIEFDTTDAFYTSWVKGAGGIDFPGITDEEDYYWLRLDCDTTFTTVPVFSLITLLNSTIEGDINLALLTDSGYQYCDVWMPTDQPLDIDGFEVGLEEENNYALAYDSAESGIIEANDPLTIGFETGVYKLLIIPEHWCYPGSITVRFAVENYWTYNVFAEYNITAEPSLYAYNINNYTASAYGKDNATIYPYGLVSTFNDTLVEVSGEGYLIVKCYGNAFQWTQLVLTFQNVSLTGGNGVDVYVMQELPWNDNSGPDEVRSLQQAVVDNSTIEFGVFNENFTLIFEYVNDGSEETIIFRIALSQYNTTMLYTIPPEVLPPGIIPGYPLFITLGITFTSVIFVVAYTLRKKKVRK